MTGKYAKVLIIVSMILAAALCCAGCEKKQTDKEIVLTTGFEDNEVFFIDKEKCTVPEINVYMRTMQDQYEKAFGSEIWTRKIGDETLEGRLKDTTLARIAQIKAMNLLAQTRGISLDQDEQSKCAAAASKYMSGLSAGEISDMQVTEEIINSLYSEYALANKVYDDITKDVNPEISDDEARTITVKHILIKTYSLDISGNRVGYSSNQKAEAYSRAQAVLAKIKDGGDFDELADRYNEDTQTEYSFGKDSTMPEAFVKAAFDLDTDQVSDIVETEYGYHIIKCVSTFDQDETDANKVRIVEERKKEAFNAVYDEYVKTLYSKLNDELWNSLSFDSNKDITTTNFFDIYNEVFGSK